MEKLFYFFKQFLFVLIILISGLTPLYSITQQDIDTLIDFAESIVKIAEKKGINITDIPIEEYYISVIEEAYTEVEKLLKEKGWTFEAIEEILYPTGLIMSFKNEINEDYIIEILAEEGITKKDIDVVLKNADKLSKYFMILDLANQEDELELDDPYSYDPTLEYNEDYDDYEDDEDTDAELPEDEDAPPPPPDR